MTGRSREQVDPEPRRRVAEQDVIAGVASLDPKRGLLGLRRPLLGIARVEEQVQLG